MISHRISIADVHAHQFRVTLTVPQPGPEVEVSLPVWIPGSYMVREFGRQLSGLQASQGASDVPLLQTDKSTWQLRCTGRGALTITYLVYAWDNSVRTAWLDAQRGFFNSTSLCLRVTGRDSEPQRLTLADAPAGWQVATSLPSRKVNAAGWGDYEAADYDELVDHPVELGTFWRGRFTAHGVPHELIVTGALPDVDGGRLLADTQRICEAEIAFWHAGKGGEVAPPPFERYVFLLNAVDEGYGGLEHRASTALIAARRDLPARGRPETPDGYVTLLGLISHEYFHTWNVKRLRPAELARIDYSRENHTRLLWFFEGFTSYYDDQFLLRTGLIDAPRYLGLLSKTITSVLATPGRHQHSVAQASFDAWVKYYRPDENSPNATVSYYTQGSLVALLLDVSLRQAERGSLDDVMRRLWLRSHGGPIGEEDILLAVSDVAGAVLARSLVPQLSAWVHRPGELPLQATLEALGLRWTHAAGTLAQRLGLRVSESALTGVRATHVLSAGAAQQAGVYAGDELLALDDWRLRRLDDAARLLTPGVPARLLVSRDQRLHALALTLPADDPSRGAVQLGLHDKLLKPQLAKRKAWLGV
ncbi:MAG: hypothetical protein RJA98_2387 [Pseudomonadota bacterium]